MFRTLKLILLLIALGFAAAWASRHPGSVVIDWQGYTVRLSAALLATLVAVFAVVAALCYRLWVLLTRDLPRTTVREWRDRRRRRGYVALTRGLVAVAAGDTDSARKEQRKADVLLGDPSLTLLLSAQTAQLAGDQAAAAAQFGAMLERPETEFLGLRGLLTQAMKENDGARALELAERARRLRPNSGWVNQMLFDLQVDAGRWGQARATLQHAAHGSGAKATMTAHRLAVLAYCEILEDVDRGAAGNLAKRLRRVVDGCPEFIPAAERLARVLLGEGKVRRAAAAVESVWARTPYPPLLEVYFAAKRASAPLQRVNAAAQLSAKNPDHVESRLAQARASLEASLWGEARKFLNAVPEGERTARVWRLMAELEESENADMAAARACLTRATVAPSDPVWVCDGCGNLSAEWDAHCARCRRFDSLSWTRPPSVIVIGDGPGVKVDGGILAAPSAGAIPPPPDIAAPRPPKDGDG